MLLDEGYILEEDFYTPEGLEQFERENINDSSWSLIDSEQTQMLSQLTQVNSDTMESDEPVYQCYNPFDSDDGFSDDNTDENNNENNLPTSVADLLEELDWLTNPSCHSAIAVIPKTNVDTIVQVVVVTFTKSALFRSTRKSTFFTKKTIATFHPKNSTMNFVQSSYNEVQSLLIGSASGDVKTPTRSLLVPLMGLRDITKSPAVFQLQQ